MSTNHEAALELPNETKKRLVELQELSDRAQKGSPEAFQALWDAVRSSSDEVVEEASNFARRGQRILASTLAADQPLAKEALMVRLDRMQHKVAGESPTPLELLLTDRVVSNWLLVTLLEGLLSAQLGTKTDFRASPRLLRFYIGWLESAHRRYLASIRELARVRKLQNNMPGIQVNTQINVSSDGGRDQG